MIQDIENIKIGKNRLVGGKLLYRRGEDAYIIDGETYTLEGVIKYFDIKPPKNEKVVIVGPSAEPKVTSAEPKVVTTKLAAILVESPSRILSYHLYEKETDLAALKLAAISRKLLLYYTATEHKEGKYYAKQPWLIDWDTVPGNSKEFIKAAAEQFKDKVIQCPFCGSEYNKLSSYVSHISSNHSYTKDKKQKVDKQPEEEEQSEEPNRKTAVARKSEDFKCPHCDKVLKSASGRTNHIKTSHPEKS